MSAPLPSAAPGTALITGAGRGIGKAIALDPNYALAHAGLHAAAR